MKGASAMMKIDALPMNSPLIMNSLVPYIGDKFKVHHTILIRESVDSLCRDGADCHEKYGPG